MNVTDALLEWNAYRTKGHPAFGVDPSAGG